MDLTKSFGSYIDDLSSNSPTPGGGNVAALCGVLSSSLGEMVCSLTIGKKKHQEFEADALRIKEKLQSCKQTFISLAQKDDAAFDKVMEAFKLPKETEEQKSERSKAVDEATFGAAVVPADVVQTCKEVLPLLKIISEKGNQNSLSDAGVAVLLISTAAEGAFLNVLINCSSLSNQTIANEFLKKTEITFNEIKEEAGAIMKSIIRKMRRS